MIVKENRINKKILSIFNAKKQKRLKLFFNKFFYFKFKSIENIKKTEVYTYKKKLSKPINVKNLFINIIYSFFIITSLSKLNN
jgi:hypothetical protein